MPGVIYEDTLMGAGDAVMGGTRVYYVAWQITTPGPSVGSGPVWDPYTVLRAGYWQLGNDLTPAALISGLGWSDPHWINTEIGQWIAPPGEIGAEFSAALAQYVRWALTPGTSVHLYVLGDA